MEPQKWSNSSSTCMPCGACLDCPGAGRPHAVAANFSGASGISYRMLRRRPGGRSAPTALYKEKGSINLFRCPLGAAACPGELNVSTEANVTHTSAGLCTQGYGGPLCSICNKGYKATRNKTCEECTTYTDDTTTAITIYAITAVCVLLLLILLLVRAVAVAVAVVADAIQTPPAAAWFVENWIDSDDVTWCWSWSVTATQPGRLRRAGAHVPLLQLHTLLQKVRKLGCALQSKQLNKHIYAFK